MRLALTDVQDLVKRLAVGYGRPLSGGDLAAMVPVWRDVLEGAPWREIERAVDEAIAAPGRFMPKPGEIRNRALALAGHDQRRQYQAPLERWDDAPWDQGRGPDGEPMLCPKCGGDVTFRRMQDGSYLGHIAHKTTCGEAPRIERAKGDFSMPDETALAEKRRGYYEAAVAARKAVA